MVGRWTAARLLFAGLTLACLAAASEAIEPAARHPSAGIWHGTIDDYAIRLCVEPRRTAYHYAGQARDIALTRSEAGWIERVEGRETGRWRIQGRDFENQLGERIWGDWQHGERRRSFHLERVGLEEAACDDATYRESLLAPGEPMLDLPLPGLDPIAAKDEGAVIRADGSLWMWGDRVLDPADGSARARSLPIRIGEGFVRVAVGDHHVVALRADGSAWGWGDNSLGQLGGPAVDGTRPAMLGQGYAAIAASDNYTFALRRDGTLWAWGGLDRSAKGETLGTPRRKPTLLGKRFVAVSARHRHYAALKDDGSLWLWGAGREGELGLPAGRYHHVLNPTRHSDGWAKVSTGYSHTAAIKTDGSLWLWGSGSWGKIGDGQEQARYAPVRIGEGYADVSAGFLNTLALKADGSLWAWGANRLGIFGDCSTQTHRRPVAVGRDFHRVVAGDDFWLAQTRDGRFLTWGIPWEGDQLDEPRACRTSSDVPFGEGVSRWQKPAGPAVDNVLARPRMPDRVLAIAAGGSHSAVVLADGALWTWGDNSVGQLGDGDTVDRLLPRKLGDGFRSVEIQRQQTYAWRRDGTLQRFGYQYPEELKRFKGEQRRAALAPVTGAAGIRKLLRSGYQLGRALGIDENGNILDWGYAWQVNKPGTLFGAEVRDIAGGFTRSFAVRSDGTLWQLAQYPINPPPRLIATDFVRVVATDGTAFGIKSDGTLWAWGRNQSHQLGDGTATDRIDPTRIGGGFVDVAAGREHGLALAADGSIWAWGSNARGALGIDRTDAASAPAKIGDGFAAIAAGDSHSLALKTDGSLWSWGGNDRGQLGDGTRFQRDLPQEVRGLESAAAK